MRQAATYVFGAWPNRPFLMAAAAGAGASAGGAAASSGASGAASGIGGASTSTAVSGAAASAGMDVTTQLINFGLNQWAAKKQFKRQKKLIQNRYQWMVQDLRAAGLNPILAVASPPPLPGVPIGGFGTSSSGAGNLRAGKEIAKLKPEQKLLAAELGLKQSQIEINSAVAVREQEAAISEHWRAKREEIGAGMDLRREPASKEQHGFDKTPFGRRSLIINRFFRNIFGQPQNTAR